jgi:hypothetical protein
LPPASPELLIVKPPLPGANHTRQSARKKPSAGSEVKL